MTDLSLLAAALIEARAAKDEADAALKAAGATVTEREAELFAAMVDAELTKITADGYGFTLDTKCYFSVPAENTDAFHDVMEKRGRGGIFKFSVHYQTLQATLRELADQHDGEMPEDVAALVTTYDKPGVLVRRAPKKGA